MFLYSGLLFLFAALILFALAGFSLYRINIDGAKIEVPEAYVPPTARTQPPAAAVQPPAATAQPSAATTQPSAATTQPSAATTQPLAATTQPPLAANLTERDRYNFYGRILSFFLGPVLLFLSASVCAYVGIRLLRSAGAVEKSVIPSQDYQVLAGAIAQGNEKAISEYIRLSSLAGTTGTFTKIGLTGLPLATIFLTVLLCAVGIFVPKFLDLAQLTLGAFIGSYVQKKQGESTESE